jgi:hypothetical protein
MRPKKKRCFEIEDNMYANKGVFEKSESFHA